jgi:predicted Rossmann fold flavoprotein
MIYDVIIVGAGAAGLFAGASFPAAVKGLVLEKTSSPGNKLLLSGNGQCNLTNGGSIKDFTGHYGANGRKIRYALYKCNNQYVRHFFENAGVKLVERQDGKVFPTSMNAKEILDTLVYKAENNGFKFLYNTPVDRISQNQDETSKGFKTFTVFCSKDSYKCKKLIIATGGCSYPATGSDGSFFDVIHSMNIDIVATAPSLVPIHVHNYPFESLSGISFADAKVALFIVEKNKESGRKPERTKIAELQGDLLLTHRNFSGPAIINISRYASVDYQLQITYYTSKDAKTILTGLKNRLPGNQQQILTFLYEYLELPKRFLEAICSRAKIDPCEKASQISERGLKAIIGLITGDTYKISGLGGYNIAMCTSGGVSLEEINLRSMESEKYPGLFFAGEVLDIDGDTGGYNLQFAFSSAYLCANR